MCYHTLMTTPPRNNLIARVFARLTVIDFLGRTKLGTVLWRCRCSCGADVVVQAGNLLNGHTKSCGCFNREVRMATHTTHGHTKNRSMSKAYKAWGQIKERTANQNRADFKNYGGRGIKMCKRWSNSFEAFLKDMGEPKQGMSLDRRNNDGHYEPKNCKWSTRKEQNNNKRTNRMVTFRGQTKTLAQWAEMIGVHRCTLSARITKCGWSIEKALITPVRTPVAI